MKSNPSKAQAPAGGFQAILAGLSVDTLQWSLGLLCAGIGAFMLVAPHQFESAPYSFLHPYLAGWGLLGLAAGIALLSVPVTHPRPATTAVIQGVVGMALLALALGFARVGAWTGFLFYLTLGFGTPLAWERASVRRARALEAPRGDFLPLLLGTGAFLAGIAILTRFFSIGGYYPYPAQRALLPCFGGLWLVAGPLLVRAQVRPLSRRGAVLSHLLGGLSLLSFGFLVAIPSRAWTGVVLYCGLGLVVTLLPWLRPLLAEVDSAALRTRLSLALALATAVTLILAVAVVTDAEERLAAEGVRQMQKVEADSIAQNVADYLDFNIARTSAVAAFAGRAPMEAETQGLFLERTRGLYPDVTAFATVTLAGEPLARIGDLPLDPATWRRLAGEIRRQAEPLLVLHFSRLPGHRPLLLLTAGIPGPDGRLVGILMTAFDTTTLSRRIDRPGSRVTVADGRGQTIATLDKAASGGVPPLPPGWDRAVLAGNLLQGEGSLAAFATVPRIGWAVAVERPRAAALAGVRRGRDMAFLLLLVCAGLAALAGVVTGRRIAHPLGTLADAVDQLAAGNPNAPVPASSITEVARLSVAFRELRDRLMARTAERERLAAELLARAEALAEADRRKDEFLAMLAHELRNPLGAISNASHLLAQLPGVPGAVPTDSSASRAVAVIERQVQHLVRMVDDLLDVSRITQGKVELRRKPLDLVEVVRHTAESTRALIEGRGIALAVSLPPGGLPVDGDLTRLEQVLVNLLRNAAKFTGEGGRVSLSVVAADGEARVRVEDTGVGIPPELLPRIFDLFTQGEQGLDRGGAGLGIGLTMVRRLVELHGGRVEAASAGRGRGAELTLWLPLAGTVAPVAPTTPAVSATPAASEPPAPVRLST